MRPPERQSTFPVLKGKNRDPGHPSRRHRNAKLGEQCPYFALILIFLQSRAIDVTGIVAAPGQALPRARRGA
jgi:hypothetical protein